MLRKAEIVVLALVLLSFALGGFFYPWLPEKLASHWNAQGEVDGYMPKSWGVFFLPLMLLVLALFFIAIPRIDPLKENIERFRPYYDGFIVLFFIFMLSIYLQANLWNLGIKVSPNVFYPIGLGLLFFYTGILLENAKRNWFIGIRTPWTMSSDTVWAKTHRVGSKLFKAAGSISLIGALLPRYAYLFVLTPVMAVVAYATVYSYFEYRKESDQ